MTGEVNLDIQSSKVMADALSRIATSGETNAKQIAVIATTQEHLTKSLDRLADTTNTLVITTERILADKSHLEKDVIKTFDALNEKIKGIDVVAKDVDLRVKALEIWSAEIFGEAKTGNAIWGNWHKIASFIIMMLCAAFSVGVYIKGTQHDITHPNYEVSHKNDKTKEQPSNRTTTTQNP